MNTRPPRAMWACSSGVRSGTFNCVTFLANASPINLGAILQLRQCLVLTQLWIRPGKRRTNPEKDAVNPEKDAIDRHPKTPEKPYLARVCGLSSRARAKKQEKTRKKPAKKPAAETQPVGNSRRCWRALHGAPLRGSPTPCGRGSPSPYRAPRGGRTGPQAKGRCPWRGFALPPRPRRREPREQGGAALRLLRPAPRQSVGRSRSVKGLSRHKRFPSHRCAAGPSHLFHGSLDSPST